MRLLVGDMRDVGMTLVLRAFAAVIRIGIYGRQASVRNT